MREFNHKIYIKCVFWDQDNSRVRKIVQLVRPCLCMHMPDYIPSTKCSRCFVNVSVLLFSPTLLLARAVTIGPWFSGSSIFLKNENNEKNDQTQSWKEKGLLENRRKFSIGQSMACFFHEFFIGKLSLFYLSSDKNVYSKCQGFYRVVWQTLGLLDYLWQKALGMIH